MNYDIVPINNRYRGMGRSLLATDLYTKNNKKNYNFLLNKYYEYLSYLQQYPSEEGLIKLIDLYKYFSKHEIKCEVIVYDITPLETVFGYVLDLLGIDIVHEMSESLLCECTDYRIQKYLNENGLCNSESDLSSIVPWLDHGNVNWDPCYIYKVIC